MGYLERSKKIEVKPRSPETLHMYPCAGYVDGVVDLIRYLEIFDLYGSRVNFSEKTGDESLWYLNKYWNAFWHRVFTGISTVRIILRFLFLF